MCSIYEKYLYSITPNTFILVSRELESKEKAKHSILSCIVKSVFRSHLDLPQAEL